MTKFLFSLLAAAVAVGGSAFTSASPKTNDNATYYVLTTGGTYVRTSTPLNLANCVTGGDNKCYIAYAEDQGEFLYPNDLPTEDPIEQSPSNGTYQ